MALLSIKVLCSECRITTENISANPIVCGEIDKDWITEVLTGKGWDIHWSEHADGEIFREDICPKCNGSHQE